MAGTPMARLRRISTSVAARRPTSLRNRLVALTLGLVVILIWVLVAVSATVLHSRFEQQLSEQQFATARYVAAELEQKLSDRIQMLTQAAAQLPVERLGDAAWLEDYLARLPTANLAFTGGMAIIGPEGRTVSDFPVTPGRRGTYFGDRDYFRNVMGAGRPYIDRPFIGRALKRPVLTIGVPVADRNGRTLAVMTGITDLTAPGFLGLIGNRSVIGDVEVSVVSLRDRMVIASPDPGRVMTPTPARGLNPIFDRFVDGYEGSGVSTSSRGITKLYSGKRVPSADWLVVVGMPVDVAFGPIRLMRNYLYATAVILTLLAVLAIRQVVRRVLGPLEQAGQAIQRMADGQAPLEPLPVRRDDEVGRLIGHFNSLVGERRQYESALADSEHRFRTLVEHAPDAIFVQTQGRFAYINAAGIAMLGAASEGDLLGKPILDRVHPGSRGSVSERIRRTNEFGERARPMDQRYLRLDGTPIDVEVSAVPCRYGGELGSIVFARDIAERKQLERERAEHGQRMEQLSRRLVSIQEQERRLLARELHDRTSPNLAAIRITLGTLTRHCPQPVPEEMGTAIEDIVALVKDTDVGVRSICTDLRPALLDYAGLVPALEEYARQFSSRTGIAVEVTGKLAARLAAEVESALFRITQEALTNCAKHAHATGVRIDIAGAERRTMLEIADNGIGFDAAALGNNEQVPGLGLLSMRERAEFAGGTLQIRSQPGQGTVIHVEV